MKISNPNMNNMQGQPMTEIDKQIRSGAKEKDQAKLLVWINQAGENPGSDATQRIVVESLRIEAFDFFGKTKGAISGIHAQKPRITGKDAMPDLEFFEGAIKEYLVAHNRTVDEIIDRKSDDIAEITINALDRLTHRIQNWGDENVKIFTLSSLERLGEHDTSPDNLRSAISSTAQGVNENLWNSVINSREARMDIDILEEQFGVIDSRFSGAIDNDFIAATNEVTSAVTQLQKS